MQLLKVFTNKTHVHVGLQFRHILSFEAKNDHASTCTEILRVHVLVHVYLDLCKRSVEYMYIHVPVHVQHGPSCAYIHHVEVHVHM